MRLREAETLPELLAGVTGASPAAPALHFGGQTTGASARSPSERPRSPAASRRSASARATAWRCGCRTARRGSSCTSRSPASARSRSRVNTRFRAHEVEDVLTRSGQSPSRCGRASRTSTSTGSCARSTRPELLIRVGGDGLRGAGGARAGRGPLAARRALRRVHLVGHDRAAEARGALAARRRRARAGGRGRLRLPRARHGRAGVLPLCGVFGYDSALGALAGAPPSSSRRCSTARRPRTLAARHGATHANGSDGMVMRLLEAGPPPQPAHDRLRRLRRAGAPRGRRRRRARDHRLHVLRLDRGAGAARARAGGRHARAPRACRRRARLPRDRPCA